MNKSTQRFHDKREAILAAAALEFNQHGIKGGTLAGVASRVGLLQASLNYYYRRKEDLAADAMLQAVAAMHGVAVAAQAQADPVDRVRALLAGKAALLADIAEGRRGALVSFNEIRALSPPHGERVAQAYEGLFRAVRQCLPGTPGLGHDERNARTHLLLTAMNAMSEWMGRYEVTDYAAAAGQVADMLLHGLARSAAQWQAETGPQLPAPCPASGDSAVREAFLRAATELVNEQGFRGASVDAISARLNLTKGSFYHHHASKDELVTQCFERSFDIVRQTQLQAMAHSDSGWQRLVASTRALVRFQLSDDGPLLRSTARSVLAEGPRRNSLQRAGQLTQRFALFIVDAMREGALRSVDASLAAQQLSSTINAASSLRWWVPGLRADDAARLYARPLFTGLTAAAPVAAPRTRHLHDLSAAPARP